jgi:hypothetical protein
MQRQIIREELDNSLSRVGVLVVVKLKSDISIQQVHQPDWRLKRQLYARRVDFRQVSKNRCLCMALAGASDYYGRAIDASIVW